MLKRLFFVFALSISVSGALAQLTKAQKDIITYNKFNKRYNYQTLNILLGNIPIHIRAHALIGDSLSAKKKRVIIYYAGGSIEVRATDLQGAKSFNYFEKYNVYFNILNSKGVNITDNSFGILASPELKKKLYHDLSSVAATSVDVNDFITINFYNRKDNSLISTFIIKRVEVKPVINTVIVDNKTVYANKSEKNLYQVNPDKPINLLIKKHGGWKDSTIQYQLLDNELTDSIWHDCGHQLIFEKLKPGNRYTLKLRYQFQKESINIVYIAVNARWYQSITFYWTLGIIALLLLILNIYLIYRHQLNKSVQDKQKITYELQSVQAQLNPHFIFNSLNSIQGLINTGSIGDANAYLSEFSSLMRLTLAESSNTFHSLQQEIALLKTYLKLEKLRFGFTFTIKIDQEIESAAVEIPNLILQPLIENSVKHGLADKGANSILSISLIKQDKNMLITIIDNGDGFTEQENYDGYGIKLTKNKIHLINILLGYTAISLHYEKNGTIAVLTFNNWL